MFDLALLAIVAVPALGGTLQSISSLGSTAFTTSSTNQPHVTPPPQGSEALTSRVPTSSAPATLSWRLGVDATSPVSVSMSLTSAIGRPSTDDETVPSTRSPDQTTGETALTSDAHTLAGSQIATETRDGSVGHSIITAPSSHPSESDRGWPTRLTSHDPLASMTATSVLSSPRISGVTTRPPESPTEQHSSVSSARLSAPTNPAGSSSGHPTTAEVLTRTSVETQPATTSQSYLPTPVTSNGDSDTRSISNPISGGRTETANHQSYSDNSAHNTAHTSFTHSASGQLDRSSTMVHGASKVPPAQQISLTGTAYQDVTTGTATPTFSIPSGSKSATAATSTSSTAGKVPGVTQDSSVLQPETRTSPGSTNLPVDKISSRMMSSSPVVSAQESTWERQAPIRSSGSAPVSIQPASIQDNGATISAFTATTTRETATEKSAGHSELPTRPGFSSTRSDPVSPQGAVTSAVPDTSSWAKSRPTATAPNLRISSPHTMRPTHTWQESSLANAPNQSEAQPTMAHGEHDPITDSRTSTRFSAAAQPKVSLTTSSVTHDFKYAKENESAARKPVVGSSGELEVATKGLLVTSPVPQSVLTATPTASSAPRLSGSKILMTTGGIYTLTSIVQETKSTPDTDRVDRGTGTPGPLPTALPTAIYPNGSSQQPPSGATAVYVGFLFPLNYEFVSDNSMAASGIFHFLPRALAEANDMLPTDIPVHALVPYDTRQKWGYITTLAKMFYPSSHVDRLQMDLWAPNSKLYNNAESLVRNLTALINPRIDIRGGIRSDALATVGPVPTSSSGTESNDSETNSIGEQASKQRATKIGIATGAIGGSVMCGAILFLLIIRYRRRKRADMYGNINRELRRGKRESTFDNRLGAMEPDMPPERGQRSFDKLRTTSSHYSRHTGQISAPFQPKNSLGW